MLPILTAAFVLSGQAALKTPDAAELTRAAYEAMHNFGAATGRCLAHLPEGAKERVDARLDRLDARTATERQLVTSFSSGYASGQADPSRSTLTVEHCNAAMEVAQGRVEASLAALSEAGL